MKRQSILALAILTVALLGDNACAYITEYTITDLGNLEGNFGFPNAINDNGQIAGRLTIGGQYQAVTWQNGTTTKLGNEYSEARGNNNNGEVVGWAYPPGSQHAVIWSGGTMTDLGTLGGATSSAQAINNSGQVVGDARDASGKQHAFIWENDSMKQLINAIGQEGSYAYSINDIGQVVGYTYNGPMYRGFLWEDGVKTELRGLYDGPGESTWWGKAYAINNAGQVVGESRTGVYEQGYITHAVLWQDGIITDLGTPDGYWISRAWDINNSGQIVGHAVNKGISKSYAYLWENGSMIDLNTLLPMNSDWDYLSCAYGNNNLGQIVGSGYINGEAHTFLLNPIPEPATLLLLGLGVVMLRRKYN